MKKFLFIPFIFFCSLAYSAPTISSISGTVENAGVVTISGASFSTDMTVTDVVWDAFEDGNVSTTADYGTWQSCDLDGVTTSGNRHVFSTYCATENFIGEQAASCQSLNSLNSRKWFVQYWVRVEDDFDWGTSTYGGGDQFLANVKFLRFWNSGSIDENMYVQFGYGLSSDCYSYVEYVSGATTNYYDTSFSKSSMTGGQWFCFQFEFCDSSAPGVADAEFRAWVNGALVDEYTGFTCKEDYSENKRVALIGFYNAWSAGSDPEGNQAPNTYRIDDVYCSDTWCRVEIGNNSVYENCTHREIQRPTVWADDSVTINVNQGSFTNGETAYLFVVDADGNASEGLEGYFVDGVFYQGQQATIVFGNGTLTIGSGSINL